MLQTGGVTSCTDSGWPCHQPVVAQGMSCPALRTYGSALAHAVAAHLLRGCPCNISDVYKAHIMHGYLTRNVDLPRRPHPPSATQQSSAPWEVYRQSAAQCPSTTLLLSADCAPGSGLGLPFGRLVYVCVRLLQVAVNRLGDTAAQEHPVLDGTIQWATQSAALASIQWRPQIADLHLVNPTYFAFPFSKHPECIW